MNPVIRAVKFDFMILGTNAKWLLYYLVFPLFFTFLSNGLIAGLSMAVCLFSVGLGMVFQLEESDNVSDMYGFLPMKRAHRVVGRYLTALLFGILDILISMILQVALLTLMKVGVAPMEYLFGLLIALSLFLLVTGLQFPAYFRLPYAKARIFGIIPLALFFGCIALASSVAREALAAFPLLGVLILLGASLLVFVGSILLSLRLTKRRT